MGGWLREEGQGTRGAEHQPTAGSDSVEGGGPTAKVHYTGAQRLSHDEQSPQARLGLEKPIFFSGIEVA